MAIQFISAQIFALVAWLFFALSYHTKRENKIIFFQIISGLLYCISYVFAGASAGFLISLFETITAIGYYKTDKDKYIYIFTMPIYILIGFLSSDDGLLVLIPIFASLIDGYGMIRNNKIMVITGISSNLMWIFYDLYYLEYVTALGDLLLVISNLSIVVYWLIKYAKRDDIKIKITNELSDNEINAIKKLDDECYDNMYRWNFDILKELYLKEKDSYILVKYKKNIIGYAYFINVTEDIYNKVKNSDNIVDNFTEKDVKKYAKREPLYINLNSIVLKREYNNKATVKRIKNSINRYINKKLKDNYKIREIYIYTVNEFEENIAKDLGYTMVKKITEECVLYNKTVNN